MIIDAFLTPFFPEKENQFSDHIVVMIDVLRASTTICAALHNNAKEIIPCESLEKAVQIYGNLDRNVRIFGWRA
jgi:phosphosulfolactate phosphohydrolase-like enzyme